MKPNIISFSISLLAGCLYALAYPSFLGGGWFPLLFVSLPLFLWKLETSSFRQSLGHILLFNLGLNITGYYWIPQTLQTFGQLPYPIALLLGLGFTLILQPHWWVYAVLAKKARPSWKWNSQQGILLTALFMTLLERFVPQQFPSFVGSPWLHLAPFLGLAPIFGSVIYSLVTYWVCLEIVAQFEVRKFRPLAWSTLLAFLILNAVFPLSVPATNNILPVRVVQANVGNFLKVSSESGDDFSIKEILKRYYDLSTRKNNFDPALIIWPETAYPNSFYGNQTEAPGLFLRIMSEMDSDLLIGGYDQDPDKSFGDYFESVFNSSMLFSRGELKTSYHKNILIPFGETLPFGPFNQTIVSVVPAVSLFARGNGTPIMETRKGYRFVTPICYEILETNYMRKLLNQHGKNHFIVNHTNDSWYGDTAEPFQHLFLSKWRALEFNLPLIRSTNTGITSVVYPDGSESERLGVNEIGVLDVNVPLPEAGTTIYQLYGIYPSLGVFIILFLLARWSERSHSSRLDQR
jgi:apolipoprotein N-acyltransferase